jgi:hypothetical protein
VEKASLQSHTIHLIVKLVEEPATKKAPKKKEPIRHIQDGIGAVTLCGVWYSKKTLADKRHPVNCKKCIEVQEAKQPRQITVTVTTPVKKLTAGDTNEAIFTLLDNFKEKNKDRSTSKAWAEKYSAAFEAGVVAHPQWRNQQVEKERERIERMIHARHVESQPRTHKMIPGDHRTYCGKTPGDTLSKDAVMEDFPSCRGCQSGEWTAKARAIEQEHPLSEPAKASTAAEKANMRSKGTSAKPVATSAKTELVKLARIGNTNEFGVFPESCGSARQTTR